MMRIVIIGGIALFTWLAKEVPKFLEGKGISVPGSVPQETVEGSGDYDQLKGARLANHKHNDGDSFHVSHGGKDYEFRLYYVDTPEKYIASHNAERVGHQARYFGGISMDDTVDVGIDAKEFSLGLLKKQPFDVYTSWEEVYDSGRYYCFVKLKDGQYLSEKLTERGLVRIYTKGESTPDGRSYHKFKAHLEDIESDAKRNGAGGWGRR